MCWESHRTKLPAEEDSESKMDRNVPKVCEMELTVA